ncbi:MAG: ABC transporter substrate-binding protein [Defluviitaleaceae bacterium]|nr:ABC transporter substrate-binding protein [Defluviitaleaceae bacterium]
MKKNRILAMLSVAAAAAILTACAATPAPAPAPAADPAAPQAEAPAPAGGNGGTFQSNITMVFDVNIDSSDPQAFNNPQHRRLYMLTHTPLVVYHPETFELMPGAALDWSVGEDLVTWTFNLRPGMEFHNGDTLTADDVLFTWERGMETSHTALRGIFNSVAEITVIDDLTIQMRLENPNMDFQYIISQPSYGILSRRAFAEDPESGYNVGTGAFMLRELVESDFAIVERFDGFWDGPVPTETITFRTMLEPAAALIALQNGEIDISVRTNPEEHAIVEGDPNLELIRFTGSSLNYLALNASRYPTANQTLRNAIAYAINVDDIMLGAEGGHAVQANTFWGWDQFGYNPNIVPHPHDVDRARELMIEAGFEDGLDLEIISFATNYRLGAQILQAQLREIGINVIIREMDFSAATEYTTNLQHDAILIGFSNHPFGDDSRRSHAPGIASNRSAMNNPEIMSLFDEAQQETNEQRRIELYQRIQEITREEAAAIPLYFNEIGMAVRRGLGGMWVEPGNAHNLTYAYILID